MRLKHERYIDNYIFRKERILSDMVYKYIVVIKYINISTKMLISAGFKYFV